MKGNRLNTFRKIECTNCSHRKVLPPFPSNIKYNFCEVLKKSFCGLEPLSFFACGIEADRKDGGDNG